jgi:hypothetical protein
MEALSVTAEIIRDLFIFVAVTTALLIVLLVFVPKMPDDNPLKRLLTALTYRVGATAAAGAIAHWFRLFRDAGRTKSEPSSPPQGERVMNVRAFIDPLENRKIV